MLKFRISSSEGDKVIAPGGLPLYNLFEAEHLTHCPLYCAQMPGVPRNTGAHIMSRYDVCEDG